MTTPKPAKIFIQVETPQEQHENAKIARKAFNNLQHSAAYGTDKENLIKRAPAYIAKELLTRQLSPESEALQTPEIKRKAPAAAPSSTQTNTESNNITTEDLTSETPVSENYWKMLAENRRSALEETLVENQELYERIADLESELNQSKSMLEEARELVNVLTEMLNEKEGENGENKSSDEPEPNNENGALDVTM